MNKEILKQLKREGIARQRKPIWVTKNLELDFRGRVTNITEISTPEVDGIPSYRLNITPNDHRLTEVGMKCYLKTALSEATAIYEAFKANENVEIDGTYGMDVLCPFQDPTKLPDISYFRGNIRTNGTAYIVRSRTTRLGSSSFVCEISKQQK